MKILSKNKWLNLIAALGLLWAVWHFTFTVLFPPKPWNIKVTVTVKTPEGVKTGSSVWQICYHHEIPLIPAQGGGAYYHICRGEAVVVDLGKRGKLFGLMRGIYNGDGYVYKLVSRIFPLDEETPIGTKVTLTVENYPQFVYFKNIHNARSVKNLLDVKPCASPVTHIPNSSVCLVKDHFEDAFGPEVHLKSVTIETTNDRVTQGIVRKYAPSYEPRAEYQKWLNSLPYGDARKIAIYDLEKGEK